jgi:hypothetical protein
MNKDWKKLVTALIETKYPFVKVVGYEARYLGATPYLADDNSEDYYAVKITYDPANEPEYDKYNPWYWDIQEYVTSLMKYVGKKLVVEFVNNPLTF